MPASQARLTKAGHMLCIGKVTVPQLGEPQNLAQWIWWVLDPTGTIVGEKHTLCYDLDDSELRKAHLAAAHQVQLGKVDRIIEFDELDWSP